MKYVYLLMESFPYEGEIVLGVYSSRVKAEDAILQIKTRRDKLGFTGGGGYSVEKREVQ